MAVSHSISIPRSKFITGEELTGEKDNVNTVYNTQYQFVWDLGSGNHFFELNRNGQLQVLGDQYVILLSSGKGVGVRVFRPLRKQESLFCNYVKV